MYLNLSIRRHTREQPDVLEGVMARNESRRALEVVGALGVIGSLIFVGLEVRESSRATRAATDAQIAAQVRAGAVGI